MNQINTQFLQQYLSALYLTTKCAVILIFVSALFYSLSPKSTQKSLPCDVKAIFEYDPATSSIVEALLCMPGLHAILIHRFARFLWILRIPYLPRLVSYFGRLLTNVDIHPGAQLGRGLILDHGSGVVIGETVVIGDHCLIYQGVTLGGTGKGGKGQKRHPTLLNHVVVGNGAKILGPITIGNYVRVGAGAVVLKDVMDESTVIGIPGRVVRHRGQAVQGALEHASVPDPEGDAVRATFHFINQVRHELATITSRLASLETGQEAATEVQTRIWKGFNPNSDSSSGTSQDSEVDVQSIPPRRSDSFTRLSQLRNQLDFTAMTPSLPPILSQRDTMQNQTHTSEDVIDSDSARQSHNAREKNRRQKKDRTSSPAPSRSSTPTSVDPEVYDAFLSDCPDFSPSTGRVRRTPQSRGETRRRHGGKRGQEHRQRTEQQFTTAYY